ncbi:MAG: TatD family hydrolase [Zhaonellaceae bacterium]|jgi:TatD DNase family protein|nr:TatD family hydrolase [Clostridia bacterium]
MLFDTHAHLNDEAFTEELEKVLVRAQEAGVGSIANIGYDLPSSRRAIEIAKLYSSCYAAVGIHPHDAKSVTDKTYDELEKLLQEPKVVAVGEIGLDYYRDLSPRDKQQAVFREQIQLAKEYKLPITIHDRDAHGDILEIIKEEQAGEYGGILHCFSGSWEMAKVCMKLGFHISLAGPVTFKNARKLQEIALKIPLDFLLLETDCPYLAPEPYRGKRNEPAYVAEVAKFIADLKNMELKELARITTSNAKIVFRLE